MDEEIAYARSLSKRIIAITCREVDFNSALPRLSALNVSLWFLKQTFDDALVQLCTALDRVAGHEALAVKPVQVRQAQANRALAWCAFWHGQSISGQIIGESAGLIRQASSSETRCRDFLADPVLWRLPAALGHRMAIG
ncbi:MAG: hypothetical protein ABMA14_06400 [Hyphomonadaceae bacterium]